GNGVVVVRSLGCACSGLRHFNPCLGDRLMNAQLQRIDLQNFVIKGNRSRRVRWSLMLAEQQRQTEPKSEHAWWRIQSPRSPRRLYDLAAGACACETIQAS